MKILPKSVEAALY